MGHACHLGTCQVREACRAQHEVQHPGAPLRWPWRSLPPGAPSWVQQEGRMPPRPPLSPQTTRPHSPPRYLRPESGTTLRNKHPRVPPHDQIACISESHIRAAESPIRAACPGRLSKKESPVLVASRLFESHVRVVFPSSLSKSPFRVAYSAGRLSFRVAYPSRQPSPIRFACPSCLFEASFRVANPSHLIRQTRAG
jgi:hypothetical protein